MFQKTTKTTTNAGEKTPANVSKNVQNARADCDALATKLALEVPRTSNLSEFPLRIAFARYALSAKAGRRANPGEKTPANVPKNDQSSYKSRKNTWHLWSAKAKTTINKETSKVIRES